MWEQLDQLYAQSSGESPLQQLHIQLANPLPYDLEETELNEYKNLAIRWHNWKAVKEACINLSITIFNHVCDAE